MHVLSTVLNEWNIEKQDTRYELLRSANTLIANVKWNINISGWLKCITSLPLETLSLSQQNEIRSRLFYYRIYLARMNKNKILKATYMNNQKTN